MKKIDKFPWRAGIFVVTSLLCLLPVSLCAQSARLQLTNLDKLSGKATAVSDVTLDGALLQLGTAFMKSSHDPQAEQILSIIKDLKGIYVRNFTFEQPNQYSQEDVAAIRAQLAAPGWSRIVGDRDKNSGAVNEVYLMKDGENVVGMAVLSAAPKALSVVNIVGPLDLTKLGALAGNLGIPGNLPIPGKPPTGANDKTK